MSDIRVVYGPRAYQFAPGTTVTIGRAAENAVVVDDPTVSREHAQLRCDEHGWLFTDVGRGRTFSAGQVIGQLRIVQAVDLHLASPSGPLLHIEPADAPAPAVVPGLAGAVPAGVPAAGPPAAAMPAVAMPAIDAAGQAAHHPATTQELLSALNILVPIKSWLTNRGWRTGWRILVIPYALLPLIFLQLYSNSLNPTTPGWAYSLYVAPLWAIAFYMLIRPGHLGRKELLAAVLVVGGVLLWMQVVTITINDHLNPARFLDALGVGYNEEFTKAVPILVIALVLLRIRHSKWDVRMWMFLGTIAGLTFGVREASQYTAEAVLGINHHPGLVIVDLLSFAERVFVDGFQHAIWAGISAFFIGMGMNYARRRVQLIVAGISIVAILHALNDWILSHTNSLWPWVGIQAFSLFLFLGYTLTAHSIERQVRQSPIFRGESMLADQFSQSKAVP
jgi:RsiW-degrading membrane proteinase PrsW (M82 family)